MVDMTVIVSFLQMERPPDPLEKTLEARRQNKIGHLVLGMSGRKEDTYRDFEGILHD